MILNDAAFMEMTGTFPVISRNFQFLYFLEHLWVTVSQYQHVAIKLLQIVSSCEIFQKMQQKLNLLHLKNTSSSK